MMPSGPSDFATTVWYRNGLIIAEYTPGVPRARLLFRIRNQPWLDPKDLKVK